MKINNIIYQSTNLSRENNNNNNNNNNNFKRITTPQMANDSVNFTGIEKIDPRNLRKMDRYTRDLIGFAANKLGVEQEMVDSAMRRTSKPQKNLFLILTDKYNCQNFYRPSKEKEDPKVIFSLVDKVQFPTVSHFRFAQSSRFGVTEVAECMEKLDYDSSKIKNFNRISRDIHRETQASSRDIINILDSENSAEYMGRYSVYEPYFKRHITEQDSIKKLDEMVSTGTYNAVQERKTYELEKTLKGSLMKDIVDVERLAPYSSNESNEMLGIFSTKLSPSRLKDKTNYSENLAEIYSTTTKDNFEARSAYMDTYMHVQGVHEYGKDEMDNITKLFRRMDEDPSVMSFVKKVSVPQSNTVGAGGFLRILDEVTPKKRDLYIDNIREIMSNGTKKPADKVVRFCALQPDTVSGKVKKGISGRFASLLSTITGKKVNNRGFRGYYKRIEVAESDKPEITQLTTPKAEKPLKTTQTYLPAIIYRFPKLDMSKPAYTAPVLPKLSDIIGGNNRLKFNISTPVVTQKAEPVKRNGIYVNRTAKQPSAQKLQVISDVNNLIEKKLGKNTLSDQSRSYERGATKMRLGMLPEIFASIKETRAQKRAAGTFSKHKSESNADALALYQMINGKNKRLVNYMLKVRGEDGNRLYSVKDIISTVGETEKSIRMAKLSKETKFTPADAKAIYTTMLDEQVAQHGKLPRAKKK